MFSWHVLSEIVAFFSLTTEPRDSPTKKENRGFICISSWYIRPLRNSKIILCKTNYFTKTSRHDNEVKNKIIINNTIFNILNGKAQIISGS